MTEKKACNFLPCLVPPHVSSEIKGYDKLFDLAGGEESEKDKNNFKKTTIITSL